MKQVYCVFKAYVDYSSLRKIFDNKDKAENWVKEHDTLGTFDIEIWEVR